MSRRTVLVLALLALFSVVLSAPPEAQATNAGEVAIVAGAAVVGVVVLTYVATRYMYGTEPHMLLPGPDPTQIRRDSHGRLRFGLQCQPKDGNLSLACW
jgi:hypothetical protein